MNWLNDFVKPRLEAFVSKKDVPDNLWTKCPSCQTLIYTRTLREQRYICETCAHYLRLSVDHRLEWLFDNGSYETLTTPEVVRDPLKFVDVKSYDERLTEYAKKAGGDSDALRVAVGNICGRNHVVAAFNFRFMGGSMGTAVGEAIVMAADEARQRDCPLVTIPASGGARMQEGILSLMQMPRTIVAIELLHEARLPHIVILTDPTTGGVSASFAMLGDIHIAERGAEIGFAGRRVIAQTIREELPDDFQTAEYLLEHGMVDVVAERNHLPETLSRLTGQMMDSRAVATQDSTKTQSQEDKTTKKAKKSQSHDMPFDPEAAARSVIADTGKDD